MLGQQNKATKCDPLTQRGEHSQSSFPPLDFKQSQEALNFNSEEFDTIQRSPKHKPQNSLNQNNATPIQHFSLLDQNSQKPPAQFAEEAHQNRLPRNI
jgi:hypothetical protein